MPTPQPNILFIMADQLAARSLKAYGHPLVKTPHLDRLAQEGVVFDNAYTPSPLCAPARAAVMNGLLPSRSGVYDNAAEFPSAIPTFAHYLRIAGYRTSLSGKMHFVGPDQLHARDRTRDLGVVDQTLPDLLDLFRHRQGLETVECACSRFQRIGQGLSEVEGVHELCPGEVGEIISSQLPLARSNEKTRRLADALMFGRICKNIMRPRPAPSERSALI